MFKSCAVQLPVTLIHMNSLDILPNSLAQVTASIEAKRARTVPIRQSQLMYEPYHQGQAFTAPRRQSLEQARHTGGMASADISLLTQDLDNSPRRYSNVHGHQISRQSTVVRRENVDASRSSAAHHHHKHHPSCYYCHLVHSEGDERPSTAISMLSQTGMRLPRLQVSTSGLGFSESEFEAPADPPLKKVMLSEQERKMINQAKELKMQRQWSQKNRKRSMDQVRSNRSNSHYLPPTSRNVAADPNAGPKQPAFGNLSGGPPKPHPALRIPKRSESTQGKEAPRARSKTNPEKLTFSAGSSNHQRAMKSMEGPRKESRGLDGMIKRTNGARSNSVARKTSMDQIF